MENLLYYPYINIPKTDWAARALLYYDKIGSIVPQRYFYGDYDPFMKGIIDNGLVEAINPLDVLNNPLEISSPFIEYLNSKEFNLEKRRAFFRNGRFGRIHQDKFYPRGARIHEDKFDGEIFYQLEQMGLAINQENQWFLVEQRTANDLMLFLASVIGRKINYQPTTDQERKRFKFKETKKDFHEYKMLNRKRELVLNNLIPFPEEIDFTKLRKFKDKHTDLLKAFKNKVELIVLNPTIEENTPLFTETINELKIRQKELSAKMNQNNLGKLFFGTACGIVGGVISVASTGSWEGAGLALPGFANAIYSALQIEKPESIFDQYGMKYLALVDKRLKK